MEDHPTSVELQYYGNYVIYDGIGTFGKERNRVKYLGGNAPFNTRWNEYYVSKLGTKKR
jgi:hypothetical protein